MLCSWGASPVSYTHLDVYKRQVLIEHCYLSIANIDNAASDDAIINNYPLSAATNNNIAIDIRIV